MDAVYFSQGSVTIDSNFARFGSKTYAIDKINTVEVRTKIPNKLGPFVVGLFALGILGEGNGSGTSVLFAIALGAVAFFMLRSLKNEYQLLLVTSSASVQAYQSNENSEVADMRHAIEQAMIFQTRRT